MASKLQFYQTVADKTINEVAAHGGNWQRFLNTSAWLYKYPFHDQLMIYAQKPNATAVAEIEFWNEKFSRWVRRGSKGIALIDDSGSYPRLKYVFDVSDTETLLKRAKPVQLWELRPEHKESVIAEIARNYEDVDMQDSLSDAFRNIAKQLAKEYYIDNAQEIAFSAENSVLAPIYHNDFSGTPIEQADDSALMKTFTEVLSESIAYTIMTRCGLDMEYFDEDAFQGVIDFNTPDMVQAIGVANADLSEQVLRDVELTIRKYERIKTAQIETQIETQIERNNENYDRNIEQNTYLHSAGGLSAPEHSVERAYASGNRTAGQVRENEESVPERLPEDNLHPPAAVGATVPASPGDRPSGEPEVRADNGDVDGTDEPAGQIKRPNGVDKSDEHAESAGGGDDTERVDLHVSESESPLETTQTQNETLSQVETSSISEILSTSPITLGEVDSILRDGGNDQNSYLRIAARFAKDKTPNEQTAFLRREYLQGRYAHGERESGKGYTFDNKSHNICAWFDKNGISLAIGTTAKHNIHKVTIPWEVAAARVNALMQAGEYADRPTFDNALDNEYKELAGNLWFFYRDDLRFIPEEWNAGHGYPEDEALIKSLLEDENSRQAILDRVESDINQLNYDEHEHVWNNPNLLL
ncbi:hypothetical protein FACS189499_05530 [Clostridia bacterium]|nr:hypothetical protein FACS189499_05530 [Clostridia bacterium]